MQTSFSFLRINNRDLWQDCEWNRATRWVPLFEQKLFTRIHFLNLLVPFWSTWFSPLIINKLNCYYFFSILNICMYVIYWTWFNFKLLIQFCKICTNHSLITLLTYVNSHVLHLQNPHLKLHKKNATDARKISNAPLAACFKGNGERIPATHILHDKSFNIDTHEKQSTCNIMNANSKTEKTLSIHKYLS